MNKQSSTVTAIVSVGFFATGAGLDMLGIDNPILGFALTGLGIITLIGALVIWVSQQTRAYTQRPHQLFDQHRKPIPRHLFRVSFNDVLAVLILAVFFGALIGMYVDEDTFKPLMLTFGILFLAWAMGTWTVQKVIRWRARRRHKRWQSH